MLSLRFLCTTLFLQLCLRNIKPTRQLLQYFIHGFIVRVFTFSNSLRNASYLWLSKVRVWFYKTGQLHTRTNASCSHKGAHIS